MELEVDGVDVVRVMLQFCQENGLTSTFAALQEESQVSLNVVDSVDGFLADVRNGRWDLVMRVVATLALPNEKLAPVYEQLVLELIEQRELDAARRLLRSADPMHWLLEHQPERHRNLQTLAAKPYFDAREAYPEGTSREGKRAAVAQQLSSEVYEAPPSRLVALVGQALKWQRFQGMLPPGSRVDLFRNAPPTRIREEETHPGRKLRDVSFGKKAHPEIARFSPDGLFLVTGSSDGFVEVRNAETGKLSKQLAYQAKDALMMHDSAVLSLDFSRDAELLVTGSQDGTVKVWRISVGQCARRFPKAHDQGITCVTFTRDSSQVLTASFDGLARLHGLRSGKMLREFRGHTSYVNDALFSTDGGRLVTAASDGTVRVWDAKSAEAVCTFKPPQEAQTTNAAVCSIALWPPDTEQVVVCNKSSRVFIMTLNGELTRTFEGPAGVDFVHCAVSPRGEWLHCAGEDQQLHSFDASTGKVAHTINVSDKDLVGAALHPYRNIVATWGLDGFLRLWVP